MKHFRKVGKKNTVTKVDVQILFNEFKAAVQDFADKVKIGAVPTIPITTTSADEPLSFSKMGANLHTEQPLLSFQDYLNRIAELSFEDEYKQMAKEIEASNLQKKEKDLLLLNMRLPKI